MAHYVSSNTIIHNIIFDNWLRTNWKTYKIPIYRPWICLEIFHENQINNNGRVRAGKIMGFISNKQQKWSPITQGKMYNGRHRALCPDKQWKRSYVQIKFLTPTPTLTQYPIKEISMKNPSLRRDTYPSIPSWICFWKFSMMVLLFVIPPVGLW